MLQCLDADPSNRPTASQLYKCLGNWVSAIRNLTDLSIQFDAAELVQFSNLANLGRSENLPCHEKAVYFSRLLDSII